MEGWRAPRFGDVPSRPEFEQLTIALLRAGIINSDEMRDCIRRQKRLILKKVIGTEWNSTPSGKFVNENAWVLENLVVRGIVEKMAEKEYRLA